MTFTINTNNIPRDVVSGAELDDKEKAEFDYYTIDELHEASFFRYKGNVYDMDDFLLAPESLEPWHGYFSTSYFSGIVIKYANGRENVIVGRYFS